MSKSGCFLKIFRTKDHLQKGKKAKQGLCSKSLKVVDRVGIMEKLLQKFNNLMRQDGQNVSLFPSNAPVHSDS